MARHRQLRIGREGLYYLLVVVSVIVGATVRQLNLLILVGTMLSGPLVFSLIYGRLALRHFDVGRKLPPRLHVDQRLTVDITLANRRRWLGIWSIAVEDEVLRDPDSSATCVGVFFPSVGAQETQRGSYHGVLPRRGRYRFGPLRVSTRFPLGLVRHSVVIDDVADLMVLPKLGQLTHDWTRVARQTTASGQAVRRRGVQEADFHGLRDWRAGDSRRLIHWRSSARRAALVVRQFEELHSRDLALLVDLWQPERPTAQDIEHVETALSFLATLVSEGCRQAGRRLFIAVAAASPLEQSGPASPLFVRQQMEALALVEPHHDARFPAALGHALAQTSVSVPTLLVSTRTIDWNAFRAAAAERGARLAGRQVQAVDVTGESLARYFRS